MGCASSKSSSTEQEDEHSGLSKTTAHPHPHSTNHHVRSNGKDVSVTVPDAVDEGGNATEEEKNEHKKEHEHEHERDHDQDQDGEGENEGEGGESMNRNKGKLSSLPLLTPPEHLKPLRRKSRRDSQAPLLRRHLKHEDIDVVFLDCDDTIYFNEWATAIHLKNAIENYTKSNLGLEDGYAFELFQKHGTALRGLLEEGHISQDHVEEYLQAVHNIPLDEISYHAELRELLLHIDKPMWIFTASIREHAIRCLQKVGILDLFDGIIDCRDVDMATKHDESAFRKAMKVANVTDPTRCVLLDDSVKNIQTGKHVGFYTVLVGLHERATGERIECPEADIEVHRLVDLVEATPELFSTQRREPRTELKGFDGATIETRSVAESTNVDDASVTVQVPDDFEPQDIDNPEELEVTLSGSDDVHDDDDDVRDDAHGDTSSNSRNQPNSNVVFVLGGPGTGKGTQCTKLAEEFEWGHLSVGDLLRTEEANPESRHGELISQHIKNGEIVPVEITVELLLRAIHESEKRNILIDGFPRAMDNLDGWFHHVDDSVKVLGVIFFEADEATLTQRLLERGKTSGRADDNEESVKKRFKTMQEVTLPVIERLEQDDFVSVHRIDAARAVDEIWEDVKQIAVKLQGDYT